MKDFLTALGLVFVIEGAVLTFFPGRVQSMLQQMEKMSPDTLRKIGFMTALIGGVWVWYMKH